MGLPEGNFWYPFLKADPSAISVQDLLLNIGLHGAIGSEVIQPWIFKEAAIGEAVPLHNLFHQILLTSTGMVAQKEAIVTHNFEEGDRCSSGSLRPVGLIVIPREITDRPFKRTALQNFFSGGYYHGKLIFPREYPFRPPSIYMITPNGRFACNTRLCLSISDFHPDTWNPAWSVSSILTGLLSFMLENTYTTGSIETSVSTKRLLAESSGEFNLNSELFCELFPDVVKGPQVPVLGSLASNIPLNAFLYADVLKAGNASDSSAPQNNLVAAKRRSDD
ncbi:ubiquitin-conjugating enzyme E2 J2 [Paragonimus westermani]|uniref:Ubiquitin-conjugating enzyme E2 J2 n=1 Tax=Paragonimus westermani TaxID=34504 RepID=A0A5J4NL71_9TREM|nr:ubiquitin-conjugating enzyme E2 J2 [Paragonimus westermani]